MAIAACHPFCNDETQQVAKAARRYLHHHLFLWALLQKEILLRLLLRSACSECSSLCFSCSCFLSVFFFLQQRLH
jgi:hypothetical protein